MLPFSPNEAASAIRVVRWPREELQPVPRVRCVLTLLSRWRARARQRRALAQLDDRMLRDLGIMREEAIRECAKPFWR